MKSDENSPLLLPQGVDTLTSESENQDSDTPVAFPVAVVMNAHVPPSTLLVNSQADPSLPVSVSLSKELLISSSESSSESWVDACRPLLQPNSHNMSQRDVTKEIQSTNLPATQPSQTQSSLSPPLAQECAQSHQPSTSRSGLSATNSVYPKDNSKVAIHIDSREKNGEKGRRKNSPKGVDTDSTSSETRVEIDSLFGLSTSSLTAQMSPSSCSSPRVPAKSPKTKSQVQEPSSPKAKSSIQTEKRKTASRNSFRRKRSRVEPTESDFTPTTVPCPGCCTPLPGRYWKGKSYQSRTEVSTAKGWAIINLSGDLVLPCCVCLVKDEGKLAEKWEEATLSSHQFFNARVNRLRQHLKNEHLLNAADPHGQKIRDKAKTLQCQHLHGNDLASDCEFETGSDELTEDLFILPPNVPTAADVAKSLGQGELLSPPSGWLTWLNKGKCIKPNTIKVYSHVGSQFLSVMKIIIPNKSPTLRMTWDLALVSFFFEVMSFTICDSTLVNYHNALVSARTYLKRVNQIPENHGSLLEDFQSMHKKAIEQKKIYINRRKESKQGDNSMLWHAYNGVYNNPKYVQRFYKIAYRFKKSAMADPKRHFVEPLTPEELFFCNAIAMFLFFINNFHRSGNLGQIEFKEAKREILHARRTLLKKFPGIEVPMIGRIDRSKCEPAVIKVDGGMKFGGVIRFVVVSPRDQDMIAQYFRIRENCPKAITTTKLFVNARGTSVKQNVSAYIRKLGQMSKIDGLNCQMLRALIETENVLDDNPEREAVSAHMGHSAQTRAQYYELKDKRHCVQASNRLLWKLEDIGQVGRPQKLSSQSAEAGGSLEADANVPDVDGSFVNTNVEETINDDSDSANQSGCATFNQPCSSTASVDLPYSIPVSIPTFDKPIQMSLASVMEASPSFVIIKPSETESGTNNLDKTTKDNPKEMDDSAFVEFLPSSEEDVHGFYSQGSHISTSPFHSAQDFTQGMDPNSDVLAPPLSSSDDIDSELGHILADPKAQELHAASKRTSDSPETSDVGFTSDASAVGEISSDSASILKEDNNNNQTTSQPTPTLTNVPTINNNNNNSTSQGEADIPRRKKSATSSKSIRVPEESPASVASPARETRKSSKRKLEAALTPRPRLRTRRQKDNA